VSEAADLGAPLDSLAEELAQMVAAKLAPRLEELVAERAIGESPWLTTRQAIAYTGLPDGTFRKLAACGKIPSHGGRSKIFYRPELDQALLASAGLHEDERQLRVGR
jgi:hypothetical protein